MADENVELKIISLLDRIRPYLNSEGGNIEFVKYEDNIVYVVLFDPSNHLLEDRYDDVKSKG